MNQTKERESGLYPVKFEGKVIFVAYNSDFNRWGDELEQYEEYDFEIIGDKIKSN